MIWTDGRHFPKPIILTATRWYFAYSLSYRDVEELLSERGIVVDHSTIARWVERYSLPLLAAFRRRKKGVGNSWRMDETYIRVRGTWMYQYRAVDKSGDTIDFYFSERRDATAAHRFLRRAIRQHRCPTTITIDGSAANYAAIERANKSQRKRHLGRITIRQSRYLNNIVEQDHRGIKRRVRSMLGFKSPANAAITLAGIELVHMIRKGQLLGSCRGRSLVQSFELLAR